MFILEYPDITRTLKTGYPSIQFEACDMCGEAASLADRNGVYCYRCAVDRARMKLESLSDDEALELCGFEGL